MLPKAIHGFNSRYVADKAARLTMSSPMLQQQGLIPPSPRIRQPRSYVVKATLAVTNSYRDPISSSIIPGTGIGTIYERTLADASHYLTAAQVGSPTGYDVDLSFFNIGRPYLPGTIFNLVEDMDGDLWVANARVANHHIVKITESGGILPNGSGEVTVIEDGSLTPYTYTAWLRYMHGGRMAPENLEALIEWHPEEDNGLGRWIITNAGCLVNVTEQESLLDEDDAPITDEDGNIITSE